MVYIGFESHANDEIKKKNLEGRKEGNKIIKYSMIHGIQIQIFLPELRRHIEKETFRFEIERIKNRKLA